ncbi:MAG: CGNR zinc finger domain-containing protein [Actinomycetota bacterium]
MNYAELRAHDDTPAAPGRLDVVQRFLNLHEHVAGMTDDRPPPPEMVREYLVAAGLLEPDARYEAEDHAAAMELFDALHGLLVAQEAGAPTAPFTRRIEDAARRASFRLRFADEPALEPALEPADGGMDGAIGHLLAILFLARLDGTWSHMKECASPTCHSVFYDRSKNHSGRWCSMRSCGNQHKVRAWRERHRADAVDA